MLSGKLAFMTYINWKSHDKNFEKCFIIFLILGVDDIIRQHKAACLRVTSLLACKELLWIGTSAGVILTMPLPIVKQDTTKITNISPPIGEFMNY